MRRRHGPVVLVLVMLAVGCTAQSAPADDPRAAADTAFAGLRELDGIELEVDPITGLDQDRLLPHDASPETVSTLGSGVLHVRSERAGATHVRLSWPSRPPDLDVWETGLRARGVSELAGVATDGNWVRTSAPGDGGMDRVADGIGGAGQRLVADADAVERVAGGEVEHLRIVTDRSAADRFLAEVGSVVAATSSASHGATSGGAEGAGEATIDLWATDGVATRIRVTDGRDERAPVEIRLGPPSAEDVPPSDAPAFALRGLLTELALAGSADGVGDAPVDDPPTGADDQPTVAPPFEEGSVLEEAFGDDNPFDDVEFDCVTQDDLQLLEEALGEEALAEVEQLIAEGYLARC